MPENVCVDVMGGSNEGDAFDKWNKSSSAVSSSHDGETGSSSKHALLEI